MIIGVDVGGTFTDVFFLDEASQKIEIAKVPSTPEDSSRGFLQGLGTHAKDWSRVRTVVHGTTVGTNALLSRKGAKTGILTTIGFRDDRIERTSKKSRVHFISNLLKPSFENSKGDGIHHS